MADDNHPDSDAVLRADDARYAAMLAGDLDALETMLGDELSYTHSSAHCEDKAQYLASLRSGRVRYLDVQRHQAKVRVHGDVATVDGHVLIRAEVDGIRRELDNRFLSVWKRRASGWQMLAWASTPIPPRAGS